MKLSRRQFVAGTIASGVVCSFPLGAAEPLERKDVSWLAEVQRAPEKLAAGAPKLAPLLVDDAGKPITSVAAWEKRRDALRREWREFFKPLAIKAEPPKLEVLEEDRTDACRRQLVRYETEPGLAIEGYLLWPLKVPEGKKLPAVVVLHETTEKTIEHSAAHAQQLGLPQQGFVVFCPKCFLWVGEGDYNARVRAFHERHPGSLGMAKMLWDAQRGVDVLASLPEVDPQRIGAYGHSLGAKETLYLAAFDERIKAAAFSEGGIGMTFTNWEAPWYLGPDVRNGKFAREHHELLAMIAPRPFLLLGGDSADGDRSWPFVAAALPVYELYGKPARLGLLNHRQDHSVPEDAGKKVVEWFATYL